MAADAQKVTALTSNDEARLAKQRAVLEKYLADERSKQNYKTAAGKLGLLRALIEQRIFKPTQTYELQSMGVVLGDAFVQELKMERVIVEDSQGRESRGTCSEDLNHHLSTDYDFEANRKRREGRLSIAGLALTLPFS